MRNYCYNNIHKLTGSCLAHKNNHWDNPLPYKIILDNNPIDTIDETLYEFLRKKRGTSYNNCDISLVTSNLTEAQKVNVRKKFHKATHTIPERYFNEKTFKGALVYGGGLAGIAAGLYACNKFANYAPKTTEAISMISTIGIGALIGLSREFLFKHYHDQSSKLMALDVTLGSFGAYFAAKTTLEKKPAVLPLVLSGLTGAGAGMFAGWQMSNFAANSLAKLSHPQIEWQNKDWSMGTYTIEL